MKGRYQKHFLIVALVSASLALSAPPRMGKTEAGGRLKKYRILSTVGRVTAWEPWATVWTDVNVGDELWESTLVQIHRGGTFSFELASKEALKGLQGEAIQVKLGTPIVVRLNEDITRQIDLSSYFVPNLPKDTIKPEGSKLPLFDSIQEAWKRVAAVAAVRDLKMDSLMPSLNNSESALALRAKHMTLITPTNGQNVLVDKVPSEIRVGWEPVPEANTTYEVRLWRVEDMRPGPLALTQIDHHFVTVNREGPYFVQVTTSDGKYQSDPHQIFVSLPIAGRIKKKTTLAGLASIPIPLLLPPDGFVYHAKSFPIQLTYEWDLSIEEDTEFDPTFIFKVTDLAGKKLMETKVEGRRFVGKFAKPGKFKWSVSAVLSKSATDAKAREIMSEPFEFEIKGPDAIDPIEALLFANKSGVLFLENGF